MNDNAMEWRRKAKAAESRISALEALLTECETALSRLAIFVSLKTTTLVDTKDIHAARALLAKLKARTEDAK